MIGKNSGVHERVLKQRHTTKFLRDILYIKKQEDCLFEHTKNNFSTVQVLQQQQKCIKNVQQSDTCVCYEMPSPYRIRRHYFCLVKTGTSENIQWYFLKRCHVHSKGTVKESKSFPSLFPGDTSNDATGWKRPVWHARVPTRTMQPTLGENLLRPASSNSHGMGMKDSHTGRQLQKVGPGFVSWPFTGQTLVKITFLHNPSKSVAGGITPRFLFFISMSSVMVSYTPAIWKELKGDTVDTKLYVSHDRS
jgi:hypothetical protein